MKWFDGNKSYLLGCYTCHRGHHCEYIDDKVNDGNCIGMEQADILPTQDNLKKQKKISNGGRESGKSER